MSVGERDVIPAHPLDRRWLVLCGLGAILGLVIAGFGLFTARGTRLSIVPAADAAIVNGVPIARSDLIDQLRALDDLSFADASPAQRRRVLDDMIREELYVQRGREMGFATDDIDVRAALVAAGADRIVADELATIPSSRALHGWYDGHRRLYAGTFADLAPRVLADYHRAGAAAAIADRDRRLRAQASIILAPGQP